MITVAGRLSIAAQRPDVMVTAKGATAHLIKNAWIKPGTCLAALGAGARGKKDIEPSIISRTDMLVAGSHYKYLDHAEQLHGLGRDLKTRYRKGVWPHLVWFSGGSHR